MRAALAILLVGTSIGAAAPKSMLVIETPQVSTGAAAKAVAAKLDQASSRLRACFDREQAKDSTHDGRSVALDFTIKPDGKVSGAHAIDALGASDDHETTPFEKCITGVIANVRFASANRRAPIRVTVGMTFTADSSSAFASGPTDSASYGQLGSTALANGGDFDEAGVRGLPSLVIGRVTRKGNLGVATIRRVLMRNLERLQYCYERELLAKPGIGGVLIAKFQITPAGTVVGSEASGFDLDVASCVARVLAAVEYPKPRGGSEVLVEKVPLTFAPGRPQK